MGKVTIYQQVWLILLTLIAFSLFGSSLATATSLGFAKLDDASDRIVLDAYIEILEDNSRTLTIDDVRSEPHAQRFQKFSGSGRPNLGYSLSNFWVRIKLDNQSTYEKWLLEVDSPKLNQLELFQFDHQTGKWTSRPAGNTLPFKARDIDHRNFVYEISLQPKEEQTLFLRVHSGSSVQIPLTLWQPSAHSGKSQIEYALFGVVFGISMIMALYNLFLYFTVGGRSYLYYVLFVLLNTLLFLSDTGLAFQFLWPDHFLWAGRSVSTFMLLSNAGGILFAIHFLETKKYVPRIDKTLKVIFIVSLIMLAIRFHEILFYVESMLWSYFNAYIVYFAIVSILLTIGLVMYASIFALLKGYRSARYYLLAWSIFFIGVIISLLVDTGIVLLTTFTKYAWQGSTLLEMVLLSFALGDRINMLREEKEKAVLDSQKSQKLALEALRRTDKLKDEFLTNTSHELRTPLHGIIGIAETLRDGAVGEVSSHIQAHLSMIITSGQRLSTLINDILDLSKLKNDELKLRRSSVQLYELVNVVLTICGPLVKNKPIVMRNFIKPGLPLVYADENRVQQILYNLVGNAIKYTDRGKITVSAKLLENQINISVEDTGKGIPPDELLSIFEPFHQVNSGADRETTGTGIGLNITRKLIELHDGEIKVSSKLGQGSTFSFTLPISDETVTSTAETAASVQVMLPEHHDITPIAASVKDSDNKHIKIMIADDEPINLQVLTNQLALEGYEVMSLGDGQSVIDYVEREPVDLLILDIMMPHMSGYDVCRRLREKHSLSDLPILMLTAKNQVQDIVTAFEMGANDYLTKPCDRKELLARVDTLIQLRRMNLALIQTNQSLEKKVELRTHELAEVNRNLTIANEQLVSMTETRRRLLANISHELGTPITLIQNYVQAVQEGIIDADNTRYLTLVTERVKVLERLTQDLFDLSKLEAGQLRLNMKEMSVYQWLGHVVQQCKQDVTEGKRRFIAPLIDDIEDDLKKLLCRIDIGRMTQVFSNLVWNAVRYTSLDHGEVWLEVSVMESEVTVMVRDNGRGIAQDEIPYLFERFYRVESESLDANSTVKGSGLGLAIVKEIVQHHQGRVWAESKVNEGSSFCIALPIWKG